MNIASGGALIAMPLSTAYCTTKGAVLLLSETLRGEAALHDIGVTVVCPGLVSTNLVRNARVVSGTRRTAREEFKTKAVGVWDGRKCPPSRVADAVLRGVEKNTGVVVLSPETRIFDIVNRLSRRLYTWGLKRLMKLVDRWG